MIITQPRHPFNLKLILEFWKIKIVLENSLVVHGKAVGNCWSISICYPVLSTKRVKVEPIIPTHPPRHIKTPP